MPFRSLEYIRHNQRRQEHLATLGLDLTGKRVLELGAGIGDHSTFFLDRNCSVVAIEGRKENCELMIEEYRHHSGYGRQMPIELCCETVEDAAEHFGGQRFDVVYCYGLLYHVGDPLRVLEFSASVCSSLLLLETCVSFGGHEAINVTEEDVDHLSQSVGGSGCRPTRPWIFNRLKELFEHVYMPATQPCHEEFPLDWTTPPPTDGRFTRAVFVASKSPLNNPLLIPGVPDYQRWG